MSLSHAVLGLLLECPTHGYQLKHRLAPGLPRNQSVNDGVLYPMLAKLEKDGLIRSKVEAGHKRPDRRILHPTAKGRRLFEQWLAGNDSEEDAVTYEFLIAHPFLIKCMFFRHLSRDRALAKLEGQKTSAAEKLAEFKRIRAGMVERKVDPFRIAILDLGMAQQREKIRWLNRLAATVKHQPGRFGPSGGLIAG